MSNNPSSPRSATSTSHTLYTWTSSTQNPVSKARRAFRDALQDAGVSASTTSDAVLAASELAANATEHATGPFKMVLIRTGAQLICEIHDRDPRIPPFLLGRQSRAAGERPDDGLTVQGRGLHIVHELTAGVWGYRVADGGRKIAWMAVPLKATEGSAAALLAQSQPTI
ncbi:ATP-binding protein [Streptomyces sp. NPDC093228]|uniref:ATP-binding protein n=1 Tax=unclassified Streptomyces TaxID=2593676 RepID=UPI000E249B28|nr:ATP-binding protein [Streptomyces sp. 3212.3]